MLINNIQTAILTNLAIFGYLSVKQIQVLTGKSLGYLRSQLVVLRDRGFLKSYTVRITAKVKAESIYHLTPTGVSFLQNEKVFAESIRYPKGSSVVVVKDYAHRMAFVWTHLYLYLGLRSQGIEIDTFKAYYDKAGNNRKDKNLEAQTKIWLDKKAGQFFMPDGIMITKQRESKKLYLVEMFSDKHTLRILQTLANHAKVITTGSASEKFGIQANAIILSVFEHKGIKEAVIKRLKENAQFKPMMGLFFFATLDEVKENCLQAWQTITDNKLQF